MATIQVVYNACHGGYGLSESARKLIAQKRKDAGLPLLSKGWSDYDYLSRTDPHLIETVNELGESAASTYAELKVVSIPIEYKDCYEITEYDGLETVVCDPAALVTHKLDHLDLQSISPEKCKEILLELQTISKNYKQRF